MQQKAIEMDGYLWYSIRGLAELTGKTTMTIRNWTKSEPPMAMVQEYGGVKLYRLADDVKIIKSTLATQERGE